MLGRKVPIDLQYSCIDVKNVILQTTIETAILPREVANYINRGNLQPRLGLGLKGVYRPQVDQS